MLGYHPNQLLPCWRVNALEHVVKPRLENTIAYIKVDRACYLHLQIFLPTMWAFSEAGSGQGADTYA